MSSFDNLSKLIFPKPPVPFVLSLILELITPYYTFNFMYLILKIFNVILKIEILLITEYPKSNQNNTPDNNYLVGYI